LNHTNIVPVYFVGSERGVHYYAMQFIDGRDLASVIAQLRDQGGRKVPQPEAVLTVDAAEGEEVAPATVAAADTRPIAGLSTEHPKRSVEHYRTVARLGIQAAEALDHAHQMGIVHRDVKPANLLVDDAARLWVTDFGLAHILSDTHLTMTGDLVGTLRYMSPEQARGGRTPLDARTDVYSLGATLYELLTLQPAYSGADRQELMRQIAFEEPRPLRRSNKAIPAVLETIVLKAMEKNPADRYGTAQELADDLRRFLADEPIRGKRPGLLARGRKWALRHQPVVVASVVVLALALLLLGGAAGWLVQRRAAAEGEALLSLAEAEDYLQQARWPEARSAARRAEGLLTGGGGRPELRRRVSALLDDLAMVERLEEIRLQQSQVKDNSFDISGADAAYAQAFRDYGLDVEASGLAAGQWIGSRSIRVELAAALDDWALARRKGKGQADDSWKHLLAIARAADLDPFRTSVRLSLETGDKAQLAELAQAVAGADLSPTTLRVMARALHDPESSEDVKDSKRAVALLRQGQGRYPGDFWLNHDLAS
jgi:hypothetical protein